MLYLDFETYDWYIGQGLGEGWTFYHHRNGKFIPLFVSYCVDDGPIHTETDMKKFCEIVGKHKTLCAHNGMYDFGILMALGVDLKNHYLYDTVISAKLHDNRLRSYALDDLTRKFCKEKKEGARFVQEVLGFSAEELKKIKELGTWSDIKAYLHHTGKIQIIEDTYGKISGLKCSSKEKDVWSKLKSVVMSRMDIAYKLAPAACIKYCEQDVRSLRDLSQYLQKKTNLKRTLYWGEILRICIQYRMKGVRFNINKAVAYSQNLEHKLNTMYNEIYRMLPPKYFSLIKELSPGRTKKITQEIQNHLTNQGPIDILTKKEFIFNPGSIAHIKYLLFCLPEHKYGAKNLPVSKIITSADDYADEEDELTDGGNIKLDEAVLSTITIPIIEKISEWKSLRKIKQDFIDRPLNAQHSYLNLPEGAPLPPIGKFYFTLKPLGAAATGRFSASNFNIQQIPSKKKKDHAKIIRDLFLPDAGESWYSLDFASQEVRLYTHFGHILNIKEAKHIVEMYRTNPDTDFHQVVADMCGIERGPAKGINLGMAYGMGKGKLSKSLGGDMEKALSIIDQYNDRFPFLKKLSDKCMDMLSKQEYIITLGGRNLRRDPDMFDKKAGKVINFDYKALNKLIQGSAADQTAKAMYIADKAGLNILFSVHDELNASLRCHEEALLLQHIMCNTHKFEVPFLSDITTGPSWGECK